MALVIIINSAIVRLGGVNIVLSLGKCELYSSFQRATSRRLRGKDS
jgi:hypothetical protein